MELVRLTSVTFVAIAISIGSSGSHVINASDIEGTNQMGQVSEFWSVQNSNNDNTDDGDLNINSQAVAIDRINAVNEIVAEFDQMQNSGNNDRFKRRFRSQKHQEDSSRQRQRQPKQKQKNVDSRNKNKRLVNSRSSPEVIQTDLASLDHQYHESKVSVDDMFKLIANLADTKTDKLIMRPLSQPKLDNHAHVSSGSSNNNKNNNQDSKNERGSSVRFLNDEGKDQEESVDHWKLDLDDRARYVMLWNYNYSENCIKMELQLNLDSFQLGSDLFALGFSPDEKPINADWCILWFDQASSMHLQSAHTSSSGTLYLDDRTPSGDAGTKCRKLASSSESGKLFVLMDRPLDPCREPGYKIDNGTTHVIWFKLQGPIYRSIDGMLIDFSKNSPAPSIENNITTGDLNGTNQNPLEHDFRRVQLVAASATTIPNVRKMMTEVHQNYLDVTNVQLRVPSAETTYWCRIFKLPDAIRRRKHHITRYEAVVQEGHEHLVHHMELFHCLDNEQEIERSYSDWSGPCSGGSRPKQTDSCKRVLLAWAMGAKPFIYPNEVGQPVGGHEYNPYLMLEVHYNNIDRRNDFIDNSGLRFYYTAHLRDYDAGVMEVGLEYTDKNSIPPKVVAPLIGHCVAECTRAALDSDEGINIFAAQLHTHLTGISSWTELIREGKLIGELNRDNHYSPHFQEIRLLEEPIRLLPGDSLVHYCLYDTHQRTNITLGGYAIQEEMCVTYLHYYPKIDLEVCKSSIDTAALMSYFKQMNHEELQDTDWQNKSIAQNYHSIEWTPLRAAQLLDLYQESPLSMQCNRSNGERFPGYWNGVWPTKLAEAHCSHHEHIEATIQHPRPISHHPTCSKESN